MIVMHRFPGNLMGPLVVCDECGERILSEGRTEYSDEEGAVPVHLHTGCTVPAHLNSGNNPKRLKCWTPLNVWFDQLLHNVALKGGLEEARRKAEILNSLEP